MQKNAGIINQSNMIDFMLVIMVKVLTTTVGMRESLGVLTVAAP
jgi:hypothetical protein